MSGRNCLGCDRGAEYDVEIQRNYSNECLLALPLCPDCQQRLKLYGTEIREAIRVVLR